MIRDVVFVSLPSYVDDRGYLCVLMDPQQIREVIVPPIRRVYFVGNFSKGTIRAFHRHKKNWDCFFISHGSAKFVLTDGRLESATHKETATYVISSRNPSLLIVPPGIWHGWMSLEDDTQLVNLASESLDKSNPDEERIPPDSFGDVWTVKGR